MTTLKSLISLRGRRALITGALGGVGNAVSNILAELGADLILLDRPNSDFSELISQLNQWNVSIDIVECDLEIEEARSKFISEILAEGKALSILINNAALIGNSNLGGWSVPFEEQSLDAWRRALELNLTAAFHLCQGLFPLLKISSGASIINIASIYGFLGPDWQLYEGTNLSNPAAYAASKGGLIQLTRWLATTMAPAVRVNAISPGGIQRTQQLRFIKKYVSRTPLRRMATELDIAGAVAFFASDQSNYITGQNLVIDGGWSIW